MIRLTTDEILSWINFDHIHDDVVDEDRLADVILNHTGNLKETKRMWYNGIFLDEDVADYYWEQFIDMILE